MSEVVQVVEGEIVKEVVKNVVVMQVVKEGGRVVSRYIQEKYSEYLEYLDEVTLLPS